MALSALFFALITPPLWAAMNIIDKYVMTHRARKPEAFAMVVAGLNLLFGAALAATLDWSQVSAGDLVAPAIAGVLIGVDLVLYYLLLRTEDITHVIGITYLYPLLIALLSFVFLGERLSALGYAGVLITISGAVLLTTRIRATRMSASAWFLAGIVVAVAGYEFSMKLAAGRLSPYHALSITAFAFWLSVLPLLLRKDVREGVRFELRNAHWALAVEAITFCAILSTYFALEELPVTIVSCLLAMQPLFVVLFERVVHARVGGLTKDTLLLPKLGAISLIVAGIVLLYAAELF